MANGREIVIHHRSLQARGEILLCSISSILLCSVQNSDSDGSTVPNPLGRATPHRRRWDSVFTCFSNLNDLEQVSTGADGHGDSAIRRFPVKRIRARLENSVLVWVAGRIDLSNYTVIIIVWINNLYYKYLLYKPINVLQIIFIIKNVIKLILVLFSTNCDEVTASL